MQLHYLQLHCLQLHYLHEDSAIPSGADAPVSSFEQEETRLVVCLLVSTTWPASKLALTMAHYATIGCLTNTSLHLL